METNIEQKKKNNHPRRYQANIVIGGLLLIAVGLTMLGHNLGWIDDSLYRILISWPMFVLALGVWAMFTKSLVNGVILAGVGAFFLIPRITDVGTDWIRTYWPLIFILLGIIVLIRLLRPARCSRGRQQNASFSDRTTSDTEDGFIHSHNTFGSVRHIVLDPVFRGAHLRTTFGGTILDLRKTNLEAPETFIDVEASFAGIELFIPDSWTVVTKITPLLGGVDDKRYRPAADPDSGHKLILRGNVTFGGVEIKS